MAKEMPAWAKKAAVLRAEFGVFVMPRTLARQARSATPVGVPETC